MQANCANVAAARLMLKQLTMNSEFKGWYRAYFIAVSHSRQAITKRNHNTSKCVICLTSKVRGIPPKTTKYDHIGTFTSNQIKLTWYSNQIKLNKQRWRRGWWREDKKITKTLTYVLRFTVPVVAFTVLPKRQVPNGAAINYG